MVWLRLGCRPIQNGGVMSSAIDICSNALLLLGARPIQSFDDGTDSSTLCANLYPSTKQSILSRHDWRFTISKRQLALTTSTPVSYWEYEFQLPSNRLTDGVIKAFDSDSAGTPPYKNFEIQGDKLLADVDQIWIDYQTAADETAWPPYFVELMEYVMAWKLAYPVTDQANLGQEMKATAFGTAAEVMNGGLFALAKTRNSSENPPQRLEDFTLVDARYSGYNTGF